MNNYIAQGEGFPADNDFLMYIQNIIQQAAQLARMGGNSYILYGCNEAGGSVSDGWMVLDGEVLPFQGDVLGTEVTIIETVEQTTYLEDNNADGQGDAKDTYFTRFARFGNDGITTYNWADLRRINPLIEAQRAVVPVGAIMLWSGSIEDIPEGWVLCDGNNGTPNPSGRFIVGYDSGSSDYDTIGNTGGASEVAITIDEMPQHNHEGSTNLDGLHRHTSLEFLGSNRDASEPGTFLCTSPELYNGLHTQNAQTNLSGSHSHSFTTNNRGSSQAHENRPPYLTLAYIMYIGA